MSDLVTPRLSVLIAQSMIACLFLTVIDMSTF